VNDLLIRNAVSADGHPVDILILEGAIASVSPPGASPPPDVESLDAAGALAVPSFVETHLHVDKALLGGSADSLEKAIAVTAEQKMRFTTAGVTARGESLLVSALTAGTTQIRAHTEIDPVVGLTSVHALLDLRARWNERMRLQIAAFPQEGIEARPGTLPLLREALAIPDTVVGGCPYVEVDAAAARRHISTVLDLAAEFDTTADMHLDFADHLEDDRFVMAEHVAQAVIERGLEGRVSIGHVTTLGLMEPERRARVISTLAAAAVTVTILPATDLFLTQRTGRAHLFRGLAPARDLHAAGVNVALSSNNVRNAFTPSGNADPVDIGRLLARLTYASTPDDCRWILGMLTDAGRRAMDPDTVVGLREGAVGDIVLLGGAGGDDAVFTPPTSRTVVKDGRVVARTRNDSWLAPI
jgi:cytosine deaminase